MDSELFRDTSMPDSSNDESGTAASKKQNNKSFWGEVEKTQTTIEDFGYHVKTEIRKSENVVVYIATNDDDETVAIKKISVPYAMSYGEQTTRGELAERVKQEMEYLSKIGSESGNRFVITYYDYKIVENSDKLKYDLYIRMDYLTSLRQVYNDTELNIRDLLNIGIDICDSLEWCHKNNKIHNNLNLNNIFINRNDRYMLGDFASFENQTNEVQYCIAPEVARGGIPSPSSDIYALGMVLYVLLNDGCPPFAQSDSEDDIKASVIRLMSGEIPTLPNINYRLYEVIRKALFPDGQRYSSVEEMKNAISYLEESMPDEWLKLPLKGISKNAASVDKKETELPSSDVIEKSYEEVERVNLQEENVLKKKNVRDYILIGLVAVVLIVGVIFGTMALSNLGDQKIESLIESGSYSVAFKEIEQIHDKGKNVDSIVKSYIEHCLNDGEYNRVTQAIPLLSEETYSNPDYFENIIISMKSDGKDALAEKVIKYLTGKDESIDKMLDSLE